MSVPYIESDNDTTCCEGWASEILEKKEMVTTREEASRRRPAIISGRPCFQHIGEIKIADDN